MAEGSPGREPDPDATLVEGSDLHADARALADYGEPPRSTVQAPLYAWRVLQRKRQLKTAHAGRRAEAEHASSALQDGLVAFAERIRPAAERQPAYSGAFTDLRRAEDVLRSRDQALAAEQDAQQVRLAQVDGRLTRLEEKLTLAHTGERLSAQRLSSAQGALAREEAKLKRAEVELRAAQQHDSDGTRPATSTVLSVEVTHARPPTHPGAATAIDASGTASALLAWTKEREQRVAEAARLRASIAHLSQRHAASKKRVPEAQVTLDAARRERGSLASWLERQVGTRTAAVVEARQQTHGKLAVIAQQAMADRATFGAELDPIRAQVGKLERAAASAARDVDVHAAALEAYDARSLHRGVLLMGVAAALLLALLVIPIVWRATRVVAAPPPLPLQSAPPTPR